MRLGHVISFQQFINLVSARGRIEYFVGKITGEEKGLRPSLLNRKGQARIVAIETNEDPSLPYVPQEVLASLLIRPGSKDGVAFEVDL